MIDPAAVDVGDLLFHDPRLSANGKIACSNCHLEAFGHADAPGTKLPQGGASGKLSGMRSAMTARYLNLTPPFRLSLLGTPSGGYQWDGGPTAVSSKPSTVGRSSTRWRWPCLAAPPRPRP